LVQEGKETALKNIRMLSINQFRGIQNLELSDFGQTNLFVGNNNSGKTSVIEAIELFCNADDIINFTSTARNRDRWAMRGPGGFSRIPLLDSVIWLFPAKRKKAVKDVEREDILMHGIINEKPYVYEVSCKQIQVLEEDRPKHIIKSDISQEIEVSRALEVMFKLSLPIDNLFEESTNIVKTYVLKDYTNIIRDKHSAIIKTKIVNPGDHRVQSISARFITDSVFLGEKEGLIKLLQKLDKDIISIEILSPDDRFAIPYIEHNKLGHVPISVFGDGTRRILTIAAAALQCKGGVLLIDEIETAFHVDLLEKVFIWLRNICEKMNIQLFATTHSLEALDAVMSANEKYGDLVVYRLEAKQGSTIAKRFSYNDLVVLRNDMGQDVR
jgi:hypothetical protein